MHLDADKPSYAQDAPAEKEASEEKGGKKHAPS